jgi:hypothetical protein
MMARCCYDRESRSGARSCSQNAAPADRIGSAVSPLRALGTHSRADHTEDFDRYRHLSACFTCPLRPRCTPTKLRRIKRWENEDVLDRMQDRLDRMPEAMGVRRQTVEHPFGTLKAWMGATHFLTRTLDKVRTEMSLHVLAYNLKRMIRIFGVAPLMAAIRT